MPRKLDARRDGFAADFAALIAAQRDSAADVSAATAAIVADVKARGDEAVLDYTARFDKLALTPATMQVTPA
ncbi:histidinol dehydrogenase, partial [Acinetobacter baumannii]